MIPALGEGAAEADRSGQLSPAVAGALRDAGFFSLSAPRRFGGHEASARTVIEVSAELARGDGSAAWLSVLLSGHAFIASLLGERTQQEVWGADSNAAICLSFAPAGMAENVLGDAIRITGRWQPLSGIHQSDWVMLGIVVPEIPGREAYPGVALVPAGEISVHKTWDNAGLRATAGDTVEADAVLVPPHRILSLPGALAGEYGTQFPAQSIYRTTLAPLLAVTLAGPVLGLAQAALDTTMEILGWGKSLGASTYRDATDSPAVQFAMASAASLVDTARLHAYRALEDIERAHSQGTRMELPARARVCMDVGVAVSRAREAVGLLVDVGGARGLTLANPVQRIWRDVETAARHPMLSPDMNKELYGRAILGKPGQIMPIA